MKAKTRNPLRILLIVLAVILVLALAAILVAGNFLFEFALYPEGAFTMRDLMQQGRADGLSSSEDAPKPSVSPEVEEYQKYCAEAAQWYQNQGQPASMWRVVGNDASERVAKYFQQEGHVWVLLCHGYAGNAAQMASFAKKYWDAGFNVLTPDALAHGESDGKYIGMGWLERPEVMAWTDWITQQDPEAQIVLHGISMGGATVMMVAGEENLRSNVKCIVEDCGYTSVWDEFRLQLKNIFGLPPFPLLNSASLMCKIRAGYTFEEASAVEQLKKASVPMLFIHGTEDTFVPYEMLDQVYDACASPEKEILRVPGAIHGASSSTEPTLYWDTVMDFVGRHVS